MVIFFIINKNTHVRTSSKKLLSIDMFCSKFKEVAIPFEYINPHGPFVELFGLKKEYAIFSHHFSYKQI